MKVKVGAVIFSIVLSQWAAVAGAGVGEYFSEDAFFQSNVIVSTETFDGYGEGAILGGPAVEIDSVFYQAVNDSASPVWITGRGMGVPGYGSCT